MAFRKRFPSKAKAPKRWVSRQFSRKKKTWFTAFNVNMCEPFVLELNGCDAEVADAAENNLKVILVDNQTVLEQRFSDNLTVVRILGDIFWRPVIDDAGDAAQVVVNHLVMGRYQAFEGIRKEYLTTQQPNGSFAKPILFPFDQTELQWKKTWQSSRWNQAQVGSHASDFTNMKFPYWANNTHTDDSMGANTFVDGTGSVAIITDGQVGCADCDNGLVQTFDLVARETPVNHFHVDYKKPIRLRENENLVLEMTSVFAQLNAALAPLNPRNEYWGGVKLLIEH